MPGEMMEWKRLWLRNRHIRKIEKRVAKIVIKESKEQLGKMKRKCRAILMADLEWNRNEGILKEEF